MSGLEHEDEGTIKTINPLFSSYTVIAWPLLIVVAEFRQPKGITPLS